MSETAVDAPGAQDDTAGSDAGTQQDPGTGTETTSQRDVTADTTGESGSTGAGDDKTARTIAAIRDDFKQERARRQAAEQRLGEIQAALDADKAERAKQMDALAVALGIKTADEPPDPAKLAAELKAAQDKAAAEITARDANLRQAQVELAVLRTAGKHGANGDALLDSRSFMAKVSGLDPAAGDFADELAEAIKAAVEAGPQYRAAPPPGSSGGAGNGTKPPPQPARSGGEHTTPGGNRQWTLDDVKAAAARNPQEVTKAIEDGLLVDLGYHPTRKRR